MGDATRSNGEPATSSARRATLVPMRAAGGGESSPAPPGFSTQSAKSCMPWTRAGASIR